MLVIFFKFQKVIFLSAELSPSETTRLTSTKPPILILLASSVIWLLSELREAEGFPYKLLAEIDNVDTSLSISEMLTPTTSCSSGKTSSFELVKLVIVIDGASLTGLTVIFTVAFFVTLFHFM